jgi:hypothetical protein
MGVGVPIRERPPSPALSPGCGGRELGGWVKLLIAVAFSFYTFVFGALKEQL